MDDYLHQQLLLGRWRDSGLVALSRVPCGARNDISDVAGVTVGHATLAAGDIQTGVTAIVPPGDNLFTAPHRTTALRRSGVERFCQARRAGTGCRAGAVANTDFIK